MRAFASLLEQLAFTQQRRGKITHLKQFFATTPDPARGLALAALTASADAEDAAKIAGHDIAVVSDGMGMATLMVNGALVHEDGVIYLDPGPEMVDGVAVLTGAAGAGGGR